MIKDTRGDIMRISYLLLLSSFIFGFTVVGYAGQNTERAYQQRGFNDSGEYYRTNRAWLNPSTGMEVPETWRITTVRGVKEGCYNTIFKNPMGMSFVYIPAGTFEMGSPDDEFRRDKDERLHKVTITQGFYMQATEMTQRQWVKLMDKNPSHFGDREHRGYPVENVTWVEVQEFIDKLNDRQDVVRYRLPTEAEWEYACRAGTSTAFYNGDVPKSEEGEEGYSRILNEVAWYHHNSEQTTHPVALKKPNNWGLYDMHGNVWEWCSDWVSEYPVTPCVDPQGPEDGHARIRRGGSWSHFPMFCRAANRSWHDPHDSTADTGFRLVAETVEEDKQED